VAPAQSWGIVGGGLLGMTLALRLAQHGRRVTLIEGGDRLGGLAASWRLGDVEWDRHYHVILPSDVRLLRLLDEIGLGGATVWRRARTGAFGGGRLHSVSNTLELMRFPLLSPVDKLRVAATVLAAARIRDVARLDQVPVADWLERWSGGRALERFWLPLLRSKLGEGYRDTSAVFICATLARLYAARRTGGKQEVLGTVPGGYARIVERFAAALDAAGVRTLLGQPAVRVEAAEPPVRVETADAAGAGIAVTLAGGGRLHFDQAVVTLAAPLAARVCTGLLPAERQCLAGVRYLGVVCASLLLRRPLAGFYVTNLLDDGLPFTGVIEMSALADARQFGGHSLVYLPRYLDPDDAFFGQPDAAVEELFVNGLRRLYPDLAGGDVLCCRVSRVRYVMALPTLGRSARLPPVATSVPGLHLVSSAHIIDGTLNVDATVGLAERTAARFTAAAAA
jgi:protoporphyrinogen oxidase